MMFFEQNADRETGSTDRIYVKKGFMVEIWDYLDGFIRMNIWIPLT